MFELNSNGDIKDNKIILWSLTSLFRCGIRVTSQYWCGCLGSNPRVSFGKFEVMVAYYITLINFNLNKL
jgi:hypothetical protein